MPRCIRELFQEVKRVGSLEVKVSFLEIYNEKITDLLGGRDDCNVRMHQKEVGFIFFPSLENSRNYFLFSRDFTLKMQPKSLAKTRGSSWLRT